MPPVERAAASTPPTTDTGVGLSLATDRDVHISVGFEPYRPLRPLGGKIRAENLLWSSLEHASARETWAEPLRAIRAVAGRDRVIWSVVLDHESGALSWEVRMLNPEGQGPLGILGPLREAVAPWVELLPALDELPDYAVLALSFDAARADSPTMGVELYQRGPSPGVMLLQRVDADGPHPAGRDVALHPKRDIDQVLAEIKDSRFVDYSKSRQLLGRALVPELFACRRLYVGRRDHCDALGFSGINVDQLKFVHERFELPEAMRAFLGEHRDRLEHLMFDVVTEYVGRGDKIAHLRTGFRSNF